MTDGGKMSSAQCSKQCSVVIEAILQVNAQLQRYVKYVDSLARFTGASNPRETDILQYNQFVLCRMDVFYAVMCSTLTRIYKDQYLVNCTQWRSMLRSHLC